MTAKTTENEPKRALDARLGSKMGVDVCDGKDEGSELVVAAEDSENERK